MLHTCPICEKEFTDYEGMRPSAIGDYWCEPCVDEHDAIDWDVIAERRMESGE